MENNGVLILPANRWLLSFVLTDEDVDWTLEAADDAMAQIADMVKKGEYLKVERI